MSDSIPQDTPQRQCATCLGYFPATTACFSKSPRGAGGLRVHCKACMNAKRRMEREQGPRPVEIIPDGYKRCSSCQSLYPNTIEYFHLAQDGTQRLRRQCKDCVNKQSREYYASHKEQHSAIMHEYYLAHKDEYKARDRAFNARNPEARKRILLAHRMRHRERIANRQRAIRFAHPERQRQWSHTHRMRHPDRVKAAARQSNLRHLERVNANRRNYYARKRQAQGTHTAHDIRMQYERQKGKCYYCHHKVGKEKHEYHVDHVIPLSRGGSNGPDNLVITCPTCNLKKHDKLPHEWPEGGKLL